MTTDYSKHPEEHSLSVVGCSGVDGFCDLAGGIQDTHARLGSFRVSELLEKNRAFRPFLLLWKVLFLCLASTEDYHPPHLGGSTQDDGEGRSPASA